MLRIRLVGMMLIAVLAFTGVASAHNFVAEKAGAVKRISNTNQTFTTGAGIGVVCTTVAVNNANAVAGKQLTLLADVSYTGCKVLGIFNATVTTAKYLFSADETVNVENTIVISVPVAGCTITVLPQNNLLKVKYKNNGANVVVEANVHSIRSHGSGGECGTGTTSTGTYTGNTEVGSTGQTVSWE